MIDATWVAVGLEGEGIEALAGHPEGLVPALPERGCPVEVLVGAVRLVQGDEDLGHSLQGEVVERLLLDGRERRLGDPAVGVTDRLVRVLPALVAEPCR